MPNKTKHYNPVTHIYYYLKIDRFLWTTFKACCAKRDRSMRSIIEDLIRAWIKANPL